MFIVDELDRCRPTFAVTLLERVKHILSVPGIVFVLSVHHAQLEEAIRTVYGQIDARNYLAKFIHLRCSLPKRKEPDRLNDFQAYSQLLFRSHALENAPVDGALRAAEFVAEFACLFDLSLREMERVFSALTVFYSTVHERRFREPTLVALLAVLRVRYPDVFQRIRERTLTYDALLVEVPELAGPSSKGGEDGTMQFCADFLSYCLQDEATIVANERLKRFSERLAPFHFLSRPEVLASVCRVFELASEY